LRWGQNYDVAPTPVSYLVHHFVSTSPVLASRPEPDGLDRGAATHRLFAGAGTGAPSARRDNATANLSRRTHAVEARLNAAAAARAAPARRLFADRHRRR
jgi:hypothetical protein